jgi:hypothetical protein
MRIAITALLIGLHSLASAQAPAAACSARSGPVVPLVVELYTSEGCNSCPPADKWLATLKGRPDVFTLAFHVDYWDRLGWTDRFASPAWTQRQYQTAARNESKAVYTPQVLLAGRDYRGWPSLPAPGTPAVVRLSLTHEGGAYVARVSREPGAPAKLAGFWAVTEDGHATQVRSGENGGATLHHEAVVRELLPVADIGEAALSFTPRSGPDAVSGPRPRRVQFVVTEPRTGAPLQAVRLDC